MREIATAGEIKHAFEAHVGHTRPQKHRPAFAPTTWMVQADATPGDATPGASANQLRNLRTVKELLSNCRSRRCDTPGR
jgi:hypothetical protein